MLTYPPDQLEADVEVISTIGLIRAPREACGLLLPTPMPTPLPTATNLVESRVVELPNLTDELDTQSCTMSGSDMVGAIQGWYDYHNLKLAEQKIEVIIWHTHPRGNVGPSRADLATRNDHPDLRCLVVALTSEGPVPTIY